MLFIILYRFYIYCLMKILKKKNTTAIYYHTLIMISLTFIVAKLFIVAQIKH